MSLLHRILEWLRAGYPDGVPGSDRVPLLALLRATPLTEAEIKLVVRNITSGDPATLAEGGIAPPEITHPEITHPEITHDEIAAFIEDVTHHDAGPENVRRVAARLAAVGWPLAETDDSATA